MRLAFRGLSLVLVAASVGPAHAGRIVPLGAGLDALRLPVSARSSGMGGAGAAVGWGDGLDAWANPALVAVERGASLEWMSFDPNPDVNDGAAWSGARYGLSFAGLAFQYATPTLRVGRAAAFPDAEGDVGRVRGWTAGVSLAHAADTWSGRGRRRGLARHADLAFGIASRDYEEDRALPSAPLAGGVRDWGAYVRWTPLDERRGEHEGGGHRVDVAYGHAVQNDGHATLSSDDVVVGLPRTIRDGASVRYAYRRAHGIGLPGTLAALFNAGLDPAFELGFAWDVVHATGYETHHYGVEVAAARVLTFRLGFLDQAVENRRGGAWGVGVALPFGQAFVARWDVASEPFGPGLGADARRTAHRLFVRLDAPGPWRGRRT